MLGVPPAGRLRFSNFPGVLSWLPPTLTFGEGSLPPGQGLSSVGCFLVMEPPMWGLFLEEFSESRLLEVSLGMPPW